MIGKLFDKVSDETLNKVGLRYNIFCLWFLIPYIVGPVASILGLGLEVWKTWGFVYQLIWIVVWVPNLMLIGVRAHRDFLASIDRMREWGKADAEFFTFHAERMARLRGEEPPEDKPPTLN